jgi:hypothetical protein
MAVYSITHHQRLDNYVVVQLLTTSDIEVGQSVTIAGLGHDINGTHVVTALPPYLFTGVTGEGDLVQDPAYPIANQVLFYDEGDDLERSAVQPYGTLTYNPVCTWITATNIEDWLGIGTASALDQTFLTQCAAAASAFCYRRRQEANYFDSLTTAPSEAVKLGTIQYGGALYRSRGSIGDSFASFDQMGTTSYTGLSAIVKQLLGIDRPACA